MVAQVTPSRFRIGTYNNGHAYVPARGRYAPRQAICFADAKQCVVGLLMFRIQFAKHAVRTCRFEKRFLFVVNVANFQGR